MIIGRPGSGKSTFSIHLQQALNIPVIHLDKYYFTNHWQPIAHENFVKILKQFISQPKWIIEGCSTKTYELRFNEADICIYLDISKWVCLYRLFKRFYIRHPAIDDRALGCNESLSWALIKYLWNFTRKVSPILSQLKQKYPKVKFITIKNNREGVALIKALLVEPNKELNYIVN